MSIYYANVFGVDIREDMQTEAIHKFRVLAADLESFMTRKPKILLYNKKKIKNARAGLIGLSNIVNTDKYDLRNEYIEKVNTNLKLNSIEE